MKSKIQDKIIEGREYIILAYEKETYEWLKKCGYNLSPRYFMRIKHNTKLGKLIKQEAIRQCQLKIK